MCHSLHVRLSFVFYAYAFRSGSQRKRTLICTECPGSGLVCPGATDHRVMASEGESAEWSQNHT